jgi:iron complex outermembrane receptor protein
LIVVNRSHIQLLLLLLLAVRPGPAFAQIAQTPVQASYQTQDLKRLSIEELMQIDVTTASRRDEMLSETSTAMVVIRQEDLRRAGVTTLAEALRLAAGVHAAQVFGQGWAISSRGFNISTANKLLVLVDGRTVYSPVFAGVFWESLDVFLPDVDRIEVIRGPGGALWGANAVNGIINVITKSASDTQGTFVRTGVGTENRGFAGARYGAKLRWGTYRVYGQFRAEDDRELVAGGSARDDVQFGQSGFRMESTPQATVRWLLQGDLYTARSGLADRDDVKMSGGNVLSRFTRAFSPSSRLQAQLYYDRTNRRVPNQYQGTRDTVDFDLQQQFSVGNRQNFVAGGGARVSHGDDFGDGPGFFFEPRVRTSTLFGAFLQDEISLKPDRVFVTLGAKVERNDFSGLELQPTGRVRFKISAKHSVWGAVSRAVRMPTRFDTDLRIRIPNTDRLLLSGSDAFGSENVVTVEGGYRGRPRRWMSLDVVGFSNRYTDIRSQELPTAPGNPVVLANTLNTRSAGAEVMTSVQALSRWQIHGSYTYLWMRFSKDPGSRDFTNGVSEANDPAHQFRLRSYVDLGRKTELDATLRFSSALPFPAVDEYAELMLRLGWQPRPGLDLSLIGQNLLHDRHEEFAAATPREYLHRGVHFRVDWRF